MVDDATAGVPRVLELAWYGPFGQELQAGEPVGLMGGKDTVDASLDGSGKQGSGADRPETLYIELRQGGKTTDPSPWFAETKDK